MSNKNVKNVVIRVSEDDRGRINRLALHLSAAANEPIPAGAVFARMMEIYEDVLQRNGLETEAEAISRKTRDNTG